MANSSTIIFSKNVPIDKGFKNTVNYNSSQMLAFLRSQAHFVAEMNNYSFIREGKRAIRTSLPFSQAQIVNYIAFRNDDYSSKWYFAFVDKVNFISPACTEIEYTIDEWSTWFDQFEQKTCYVIREHVNNDSFGANTIDEGLSVGQVIASEEVIEDESLYNDFYVACMTNWNPSSKTGFSGVCAYTKQVFGGEVHLFNLDEDGLYNLEHYIFIVNNQGHIGDLHYMFIIPKILVPENNYTTETATEGEVGATYKVVKYDSTDAYKSVNKFYNISKKTSGYSVKNNKCYCYPYNYLLVTNGAGGNNIYRYEDFESNSATADFQLQLALAVGVSGRLVPLNYKGVSYNNEESLELGKYPTCSWSSDVYTNWLTQQAVNFSQKFLGTEITHDIAQIGGSLTNLLPSQIAGALGNFSSQQLLPQIEGGQATADVNYASNSQGFRIFKMRAKPEIMSQIDDYFSRFGYKILRIKTPNMTGRQNWNYVEIGEGEIWIEGEIPAESKEIINEIARKGVTIWHDMNNVGNFNLNNPIV